MEKFDFLILNDRSEESLVLASIRSQIPICDLVRVHNRNVRVGTSDLQSSNTSSNDKSRIGFNANNITTNASHSLSCMAQWVKKRIPPHQLQQVESCTHSSAGKIERLIFTLEDLKHVEASNVCDIGLLRNHILAKYNSDKQRVLEEYGVTQDDLDKVVEAY